MEASPRCHEPYHEKQPPDRAKTAKYTSNTLHTLHESIMNSKYRQMKVLQMWMAPHPRDLNQPERERE